MEDIEKVKKVIQNLILADGCGKCYFKPKFKNCDECTVYLYDYIENYINKAEQYKQNKDKEIAKLTAESTEFESKVYDLQDKNKLLEIQIDLMAEWLLTDYHSKEWVKEYFEKEARKNNGIYNF